MQMSKLNVDTIFFACRDGPYSLNPKFLRAIFFVNFAISRILRRLSVTSLMEPNTEQKHKITDTKIIVRAAYMND